MRTMVHNIGAGSLVFLLSVTIPVKANDLGIQYTHDADSETISLQGIEPLLKSSNQLFQRQDATIPQDTLQPPMEHFNFYLPGYSHDETGDKLDAKSSAMLQFAPPDQLTEPNYYVAKPKKTPKKYFSGEKHVNMNTKRQNMELELDGEKEQTESSVKWPLFHPSFVGFKPIPEDVTQHFNMNGFVPMTAHPDEEKMDVSESRYRKKTDGHRMQFHFQGLNGPESYEFGYDTGKGKDRQFRIEERDNRGNIKGRYGYRNSDGQMTVVKYAATKINGFQIVD